MRPRLFLPVLLAVGMTATSSAAIFPQLALGGGYECILIISNKTDAEWTATAYALREDRQAWTVGWRYNGVLFGGRSQLELAIPPKASRKIELFGDETATPGYLKITPTSGHADLEVAFSFFYNFKDSQGRLLDSTGVTSEMADKEFMLPVEKSQLVNTGLAWATLFSGYSVELTLYDQDGTVVGTETVARSGHYSKFFSEIFEGVPENFVGMLQVNSDTYIYMTALRLEYTPTGFQLTSVPPDDFIPSD